jgi:hypothetical protein
MHASVSSFSCPLREASISSHWMPRLQIRVSPIVGGDVRCLSSSHSRSRSTPCPSNVSGLVTARVKQGEGRNPTRPPFFAPPCSTLSPSAHVHPARVDIQTSDGLKSQPSSNGVHPWVKCVYAPPCWWSR